MATRLPTVVPERRRRLCCLTVVGRRGRAWISAPVQAGAEAILGVELCPPPNPQPPFLLFTTISIVRAHWSQTKTDCKCSSGSESLGRRWCVCSFSTVSDERDASALRAGLNLWWRSSGALHTHTSFRWPGRERGGGFGIDRAALLVAEAPGVGFVFGRKACVYVRRPYL